MIGKYSGSSILADEITELTAQSLEAAKKVESAELEIAQLRADYQAGIIDRQVGEAKLKEIQHRLGKILPTTISKVMISDTGRLLAPKALQVVSDENYPYFFSKYCPRRYEHTGGYYSPNDISAELAIIHCKVLNCVEIEGIDPVSRLLSPALGYLLQHNVPLLFLARSFLQAVQGTDFKEEVDWTDIKMPYEHGIFVLPENALVSPLDGPVGYIVYSRVPKGAWAIPETPHLVT